MDTLSFQVAELLMDAALDKEFKFTTQQAVNYILPKLSGPPKRRESLIKSAIKKGLKEELYLECGDQYQLALPPIDFIQESQQNIRYEMDNDWDMSDIIVLKQTDSKQMPKKKPSTKKVPSRIEEKKTTRHPKGKKTNKTKKPKKTKVEMTNMSKMKIGQTSKRQSRPRIKSNKKPKRSDLSTSMLSSEEINDLSKCMISIHSLDKMSERKSSIDSNEEFVEDSGKNYMERCFSNEASSSKKYNMERKQSETSLEEDIHYKETNNTDYNRPRSANNYTSFSE